MKDHLSKAHIALLVPSLRGGGAERIMLLLANRFAKLGWKVDLVLLRREGAYLDEVSDVVRIVDLNVSKARYALSPMLRYFRCERPRAVLCTLGHLNVTTSLALFLSGLKVRLVLREASMLNPENKQSFRDGLFRLAYRWAYRRADCVVGISEGVSQDIIHATGRTDVVTIHNPIDVETVREKARDPIEHPWFDDTVPVIIGVGRLVRAKDFGTLINAFAAVRREQEARLIILGEGPERPDLEQLIKDLGLEASASLPGFTLNPFRYVGRSAVFVLSSRWEGFGNALVEAMACGVPVVSTDCSSGPSEILQGGRWGRLVPVGDHEAMAEAIIETLKEDRSDTAPSRVMDFSVDIAVHQYLKLLGLSSASIRTHEGLGCDA
ncbi:glycosyltransferase [Pseudorhizobium endolithicum]|uniref:Glycosyltransferase n=1 Tax=Pseudorhizobium endolithicum TaxID=1191678 RepID=A0ABN7JQZ1_9HYPH|nr:glycosyltransferase [Pseudorhizobium endolithicum]CAD7035496.1 glycosyltransferase [Pseudorhizobium endolithicum]